MERSGEAKLTKESIKHLVRLRALIKLLLENLIKLFLELLNVLSDLWWNQMSQLGIELRRISHLFLHIRHLHEILRVKRRQLTRCRLFFIIDCLIIVMCLGQNPIHFCQLGVHVCRIHLTSLIREL